MRPSPGLQRACALSLMVAAMFMAYFCLFHWWLVSPLQHISDEEQELQISYQRFAILESQRSVIQARLDETEKRPLPKGSFLVASGAEAATAQLMHLVSSRIASKPESGLSCSITNRLPQAAEEAGEVVRIRVDVELECGIESLIKTLYRMETEPPFLKVDALSIQRTESVISSQPFISRLAVKLQVTGYLSKAEVNTRE